MKAPHHKVFDGHRFSERTIQESRTELQQASLLAFPRPNGFLRGDSQRGNRADRGIQSVESVHVPRLPPPQRWEYYASNVRAAEETPP